MSAPSRCWPMFSPSGHAVALDDDGELTVDPLDDLHEHTLHILDAFEEDLVILLTAGGPTVR